MFKPLLVPIDGSDLTDRAMTASLEFAHQARAAPRRVDARKRILGPLRRLKRSTPLPPPPSRGAFAPAKRGLT